MAVNDQQLPSPLRRGDCLEANEVERALGLTKAELECDMKLMGCIAIGQLSRDNLRLR
jgi:hypothetical protein